MVFAAAHNVLAQTGHPDTLNPCGGKADIDRMRRNVR
jgi:hypothetical protein